MSPRIKKTTKKSLEGEVRKNKKIHINAQKTGPITRSGKGYSSMDQGEPRSSKDVAETETATRQREWSYVDLPPKKVNIPPKKVNMPPTDSVKLDTTPNV